LVRELHAIGTVKSPIMTEERRLALENLVANFVLSGNTKIAFSVSMSGFERKFLHEEGERYGCTSQAFGKGRHKFLCLFKGSRFREERPTASAQALQVGSLHCQDLTGLSDEVRSVETRVAEEFCARTDGQSQDTKDMATTDSDSGLKDIVSPWQDSNPLLCIIVAMAYNFLHLPSVLQAAQTCSCWKAHAAMSRIALPPSQIDAVLQFCLLEVLWDFDEKRLPFPLSAIYSGMCTAARRVANSTEHCARLESSILDEGGSAANRNSYHVPWFHACADLRRSSFKTLDRLGKYFRGQRLIDTYNERFKKQVHHNFRTCQEVLLIRINRQHPLMAQHNAWRLSLSNSCGKSGPA
jgi:hypothetical protein